MQLSLFPDLPPRNSVPAAKPRADIALTRIRPEQNEWRFYRLGLWPDLFGQVCLVREWGRIGRPGQMRHEFFPDGVKAAFALDRLASAKRKRGYGDTR
jgi:predicted DNA-binding WGR domain protein